MKSALTELQLDLKEKQVSIDECHKMIAKLKDEYSKTMKGYLTIQDINNELVQENENQKKQLENVSKTNIIFEKTQKKYEQLSTENDKLRKENNALRANLIKNGNVVTQKERDLKDKEMLITDLKERTDNWVSMIKEREQIILEANKKIKELNDIINQKDEQLKVMVNFSKEINNENKSNVTELTKQAVKTIKIFYNTLNNSSKDQVDTASKIEFKNTATTFNDFEPTFKAKKTSFMLEDAVSGLLYIPDDLKSVSKEFLMGMNLKTELIKGELYSSLLRESTFVSFLEDVFAKLNVKDAESIESLCSKVIMLKTNYENVMKENEDLKRKNVILMENKNQFDLYTKKLKNDMKNMLDKLKEKYNVIEKGLDAQLAKSKEENRILKEKCKRDIDKLKAEIVLLRGDKTKKEKENEQLKKAIEDQKLNQKLFSKIDTNFISTTNWNETTRPMSEAKFTIVNNANNVNIINRSFHSETGSIINDSFNEKNYKQKKKEINSLKDEISKMKSEMANLIANPNQNLTLSGNNNFDKSSSQDGTKQLLQIEKEKNNTLNNDIIGLRKYIQELESKLAAIPDKDNALMVSGNKANKFTPDLFIKMFFDVNMKLFSSSELKKFYAIYNAKNIIGVIEIFGKNCELIKRQIYEARFDIDTSYTDMDESFINSRSIGINNSYRLVNDKIIRLKKFEFDFINLSEFLKNYLVAQEIVVKMSFSAKDEIQFEPIEHLYKLFEDCLNYKIDDMNDDIIFNRKVLLRMMRNQKNCLGLSLEYAV